MPFEDRRKLIQRIEALRDRRLVCLCNFDRQEEPADLGLNTQFAAELKEPLFRVLKETAVEGKGIDLLIYTRGGDTNAVWPIVCLLREFDADFEVLVPFRCHSSGTLLALGARQIWMGPLAELSPIDPTTGNQFNPSDPARPTSRLGISVEDLTAYQQFVKQTFGLDGQPTTAEDRQLLLAPIQELLQKVHPLALGNVHRTQCQIEVLARALLQKHYGGGDKLDGMIKRLTTSYYSHHHMISRREARDILGEDHVGFADDDFAEALDCLLRQYEDDFGLRQPFILSAFIEDDAEKEARFIGGCVESDAWGYLFETQTKFQQFAAPPQGINIQVPGGQPIPLIPGIPRRYEWKIMNRRWVHNKEPKGVTI